MEENNVNHGTINSEGGNVQLGNNYVTNIFEGLSFLLTEYKEQLKKIEELVNDFKVTTALKLLVDLETRVSEIDHAEKNKILSKINFLKASCKRELIAIENKDAAKDFINAYNLNKNDTAMRDRACVEYLNVGDPNKSLILADEILVSDEYNKSAWFAKCITSSDLMSFLSTIPRVVVDDYNFQLSLIQHIITIPNIILFEDLKEFNLSLNIDFTKYKTVTFNSLEAWRLATDLAINKVFNDYPQRYIHGDNFILQDNPTIKPVFDLLGRYIERLKDTEIKDSIIHQKFFHAYFGYLLTNEGEYFDTLNIVFPQLDGPFWFYTFSYCQILNHRKDYSGSILQLEEYEKKGGDLNSEFYLFKSALYHLTNRSAEVVSIFSSYLDSIDIIEERNGFNIINAYLNILYKKVADEVLVTQLDKINEKKFKNEDIRLLLGITIKVRYFQETDDEKMFEDLVQLKQSSKFDHNWRNLIVENLNAIGKRSEAIAFLESYLDKNVVSESLRFFIVLLHQQLCDKTDQERGRYAELLELLKFWRLNAKYADEMLLKYEHNLYTEINDLKSLEEIDGYLYRSFPTDEQYILLYLNVLERAKNLSKIKEVSDAIDWEIENEQFGVSLGIILMRNNINAEKGFNILFKLASNPNNTIARKNYFGCSLMLKEHQFFVSYDEVKIGCWVTYLVNEKKEYLKIEKDTGLQKEFIGRKTGENFTTVAGFSNKMVTIQIVEILNDAWQLLRNIQEEASNPVNELGFESLQMPTDFNDFENFLKLHFGAQGTKEKEYKEKALDDYFNYRTGFSEVSRSVFRENYLDAYLHLTGVVGNKFTTLPSQITKSAVSDSADETRYALDFSTLLLFYFLEKELGFDFIHRFTVSYLLKVEIDREIIELSNSPSSPMTLQITQQFVRKYEMPEDYNQKRIEFLQQLLDWINLHCDVDLVPEKLDLLPKFDNQEKLDNFMKLLVDNICISDRSNFKLISSDSTLFLFSKRGNTIGNIVNPEKYLSTFYPEKCDIEFYRFLLKSNYMGININFEILKNEFYQYLGNGQSFYNLCLENLQYTVHGNPQVIITVSKFLRDLYVMPVLSTEQKNSFAYTLLSNVIYGMPKEVLIGLNRKLLEDFRLMGNLYDEVIAVFRAVINQ